MKELDKILRQELYFELQKIDEKEVRAFEKLLLWIVEATEKNVPVKKIKKYIEKFKGDPKLLEKLQLLFSQQYENITGVAKKFNMSEETLYGNTFKQAVQEHRDSTKKRARRFMAETQNSLLEDSALRGTTRSVKTEVERFKKNYESFVRTNAKASREYAYQKNESAFAFREVSKDEVPRGWMSIAVLDNRTSAICAGLHNRFYSYKDYKSRGNVPDIPPRHPNCRSILITVWGGVDIRQYKGENLSTFLKRNPEDAKSIMGIKKYKLWSEGKANINKFIDIKGKRFFRNDEIIKKLGIKKKV